MITPILERFIALAIKIGMPLVSCYHLIIGGIFLNTSFEEASGIEKIANDILSPVQYLLGGVSISKDLEDRYLYKVEPRFNYTQHFPLKVAASIITFPISLMTGSSLKMLALLSQESMDRYHAFFAFVNSTTVKPNLDYYRSIGLQVEDFKKAEKMISQGYPRRPGDENHLKEEKEALAQLTIILHKNNIPFWVDCGTCLGAYRHGGVIPWDTDIDIAVLEPDFQNIKHALNALDKSKYFVQDWSGRDLSQTYLKVYIKKTGSLIDIYHFQIDQEKRTIEFILSNENNIFLPKSWKNRERRYVVKSAFETVFPLKRATFDGIEIPVPNNTQKYLQERYGNNIEPAKIYNEKTGNYEKDLSHPYWKSS